MSQVYVTIWFDVEDYIAPESDDVLKSLIEIFERQGEKGTFKLVGEKLRVLERRGRQDIIDLLRNQDVGYHTDFHSVHPTPAEYLKELNWDDGVAEFQRIEGLGHEDVKRVFQRISSCYGQPGSSWGPQSYGAMKNWGIPVYLDECRQIGLNEQPFWYCGVLNVLNMRSNCTRLSLRGGDDALSEAKTDFQRIYERLKPTGGLISIYYHPCEFSTLEFWDGVNFARGANPPREQWKSPRIKPKEISERNLGDFEQYLAYIKSIPEVKIVTATDIVELYPDRALGRKFSMEELAELTRSMEAGITYKQFDGMAVSPAEIFKLVINALADYLTSGKLPRLVTHRAPDNLIGPTERFSQSDIPGLVSAEDFFQTCLKMNSFMSERSRPDSRDFTSFNMPNYVNIGKHRISPTNFFVTACHAFGQLLTKKVLPAEIPIRRGELALEEHVTGEGCWGWVIFPEAFDAPELIELGKLQTWTLKPAISNFQECF